MLKLTISRIFALTLLFPPAVELGNARVPQWTDRFLDAGDGRKFHPNWGYLDVSSHPLVFSENIGWLSSPRPSSRSLWLIHEKEGWIEAASYPWIYSAQRKGWLFAGAGEFYDLSRQTWFDLNTEEAGFREPPVIRSIDGLLEVTLEMRRTPFFMGGRQILTNAYNGSIPGPTFRVKPGDQLKIRLINNMTMPVSAPAETALGCGCGLPSRSGEGGQGHSQCRSCGCDWLTACTCPEEGTASHEHCKVTGGCRCDSSGEGSCAESCCDSDSCETVRPEGTIIYDLMGMPMDLDEPHHGNILVTNLHTHGLQVDPTGNADNPFIDLLPGHYIDLDIQIPDDQPAGLFWYHPHRHMTTARQGWNGLAGAIIVEGGLDELPAIASATERLMIVNEMWLDQYGQVPFGMVVPIAGFVPFSSIPATPTTVDFPINGVKEPVIDIRPGEVQRWRILNAAPHRALLLSLEGHTFYQIAQDGIHFTRPVEKETIDISSGNRVEVLVKGGPPGSYPLEALRQEQGHPGGPRPERLLGTVASSGAPTDGEIPAVLLPSPEPDISNAPIAAYREVRFKGNILSAPVVFFLDGLQFDPGRIDNKVTAGTAEEWLLINEDIFHHPFHIHVNPFQVLEVNGQPAGYGEDVWWDTFALPSRSTVKIRQYFRPDITGKTVYHCHILPHEDNGMMSAFELALPDGTVPDPPVVGPFPTGLPVPPVPEAVWTPHPERPYVFTQTSQGRLADVPVGALVQVQLPGDPSVWRIRHVSAEDRQEGLPPTTRPRLVPNVVGRAASIIPSPGRIPGSESIYQFDFVVRAPGMTTIVLQADPPVDWLENPYTLTIRSY